MSNQELDKLFKNKLEDLKKVPSAAAWERVKASTHKSLSPWVYLQIAAAVIVLMVFAALMFNINKQPSYPRKTIVTQEDPVAPPSGIQVEKQSRPDQSPHELAQAGTTETPPAKESLEAASNDAGKITEKEKQERDSLKRHETEILQRLAVNTESIPQKEEAEKRHPVAANEGSINNTRQPGSRTLTFDIEEFAAARIPSKAEIPAEEPDKETTWKKVVDFAKDLKEGNDALGEIRETKNELFALNFKKNDTKN